MKIVFAGTPEFALPVLQVLLDSSHELVAVYTRPDRPSGRGQRLTESAVKRLARRLALPVCQPVTLRNRDAQAALDAFRAELIIVVAYGLILPPAVLEIPRLGCINVHASLLPRWRGAAPVQRAILAGDRETGVCLMQMDSGLDTGAVLATAACPIEPDDTGGRLHDRLSVMGAQLLKDNLDRIARGELESRVQDDSQASYADKLDKAEAMIDWTMPAEQIARQVRAFNPWPVAETRYSGRQLRIWEARPVAMATEYPPGMVLAAGKAGIDVACGVGALRILAVQLAGARQVSSIDFINAHPLEGVRFSAA
ncbi:MAG: methionyl-tRNA formyltransferase [Gammaproteobacteria bacterium]